MKKPILPGTENTSAPTYITCHISIPTCFFSEEEIIVEMVFPAHTLTNRVRMKHVLDLFIQSEPRWLQEKPASRLPTFTHWIDGLAQELTAHYGQKETGFFTAILAGSTNEVVLSHQRHTQQVQMLLQGEDPE